MSSTGASRSARCPSILLLSVSSVRDAALAEKTGDAIASFTGLIVNAELASIWQRAVVLKEVQLDAPDVNLVVERDGSINLAHLAPAKAEPQPAADEATAPLPRIRIGRLAVNAGRVDFEDRTRPAPFTATLSPIRFALEDFQTDLNHENAYQFAARSGAGETLDWSGSFTAQPLGSNGRSPWGSCERRRSAAICRANCRSSSPTARSHSQERIGSRSIRR